MKTEVKFIRQGIKDLWNKMTGYRSNMDYVISSVVAAAQLYLKGLDVLNALDPSDSANKVSHLVDFFGKKFSAWLASPKVFTDVFDSASRSQKEAVVGWTVIVVFPITNVY